MNDMITKGVSTPVPEQIAETQSRIAWVAMRHGSEERAVNAIREGFRISMIKTSLETEIYCVLNSSELETSISTMLLKSGIKTVGELIQLSPEELKEVEGISDKSAFVVAKRLRQHGFCLMAG